MICHAVIASLFAPLEKVFRPTLPADIPTSPSFGVFVTVRRKKALSSWPTDVHGCIGHWDPGFQALSPKQLLAQALRVGHDAMYSDSRKNYFPDITTDPLSEVEVSFMQAPVYSINASTGRVAYKNTSVAFRNSRFGVIVQSADGSRATYLPNVFEDSMQWSALRSSIDDKAGSSSRTTYYAYETVVRSMSLLEFVYSTQTSLTLKRNVCSFVKGAYAQRAFIPYEVTASGQVVWDEGEDVRNAATIADVMQYNSATLRDPGLERALRANAQRYLDPALDPQVLAFALPLFPDPAAVCARLRRSIPSSERSFERGEIIRAVATTCGKDATLTRYLTGPIDNVFQWNWDSQAFAAAGVDVPALYTKWILEQDWSDAAIRRHETNVLAVAFEGAYAHVHRGNRSNPRRLLSLVFRLFLELMNRYSSRGLFLFLNKSARVDITCHVLGGLQ